MKTIITLNRVKVSFLIAIATMLSSWVVAAQSVPDKVEVDVDTASDSVWYGEPWIWLVGIVVFVLIIIAITRSGSKSNA